MSETVMEYMAKFGLDTSELSSGLTGAAISFDALQMAADMALEDIQKGFEATVGAAAEFGDTIQRQANILGDSTDNIQKLRAAAIATDTDFQSATQAVKMFSQRVEEGGAAGDTLRQKIQDMGVSLTDQNGNLKTSTELFMEINQHLGEMPDVFERNNLAMDIYGRSWGNVANMIVEGDKAAQAFAGTDVISQDQIKALDDFQVSLNEMNAQIQMGGVHIGQELLPAAKEWMKIVDDMLQKGAPLETVFSDLNTVLVDAARGFNLVGFSAQAMWDMLVNHNMDAFKQDLQNESDYIKSTQTADALAAQGYIEGAGQTYDATTGKWVGGTTSSSSSGSSGVISGSSINAEGGTGSAAYGPEQQTIDYTKTAFDQNGKANTFIGFDSSGAAVYSSNPYAGNASATQYAVTGGNGATSVGSNASQDAEYRAVMNAFKMAQTDTTNNPYLTQIKAIAAEAAGSGTSSDGSGYDWTHTSSNQSIMSRTMAELNAYAASTASTAPVVNIAVSVPAGSDAQTVANLTAEAVSRALARQVSST